MTPGTRAILPGPLDALGAFPSGVALDVLYLPLDFSGDGGICEVDSRRQK